MRPLHVTLLMLACVALSGCYNSEQLVEEARNRAIRNRLEELDLGTFRTTLPQDEVSSSRTEVVLELFGTAVRYKMQDVQEAVEANDHRLRQALLVAIRQTTPEEMADADLDALRRRLLEVTNAELSDTPIESLGIREMQFIPL